MPFLNTGTVPYPSHGNVIFQLEQETDAVLVMASGQGKSVHIEWELACPDSPVVR
ncbi:hypothetical protein D3C76_1544580 [compost metagenome]